jgi:hypothetical protein
MSESWPRSTAAIDADLRALCAFRRDAQRELAEVRRRQGELADLEVELTVAIDVRSRRIDDVLDERLRVVPAAEAGVEPLSVVEGPSLAGVR